MPVPPLCISQSDQPYFRVAPVYFRIAIGTRMQ
jgi:hypothetical protein